MSFIGGLFKESGSVLKLELYVYFIALGKGLLMNCRCLHGFVSGRVQGVFFRDCSKNKADELGICGWVRNRSDGKVEFLIFGKQTQLAEMIKWLKIGPPAARVDLLELEGCNKKKPTGFFMKKLQFNIIFYEFYISFSV